VKCSVCGFTMKRDDGSCLMCAVRAEGPYVRICSLCGEPDYPLERSTCFCPARSSPSPEEK